MPPACRGVPDLGKDYLGQLYNAPRVPGRALVGVDNSGSMEQPLSGRRGRYSGRADSKQPASEKSMLHAISVAHLAGMFAAARFKASPQDCQSSVALLSFGSGADYIAGLNPRASLLTLTRQLARNAGGASYAAIFSGLPQPGSPALGMT